MLNHTRIMLMLATIVSVGIHGQQQMVFVTDGNLDPVDSSQLTAKDWNYDKNGTDWATNYESCNASNYLSQSPIVMNISEFGSQDLPDWSNYQFSFVPNFWSSKIKLVDNSDASYTYTIWLDKPTDKKDKLLGFWAAEPKVGVYKYVRWEVNNIMFHYPSEHKWAVIHVNKTDNSTKNETKQADLEMQIQTDDIFGIANTCSKSRLSGLSLFFFLNETADETKEFFKFTESGGDPTGQDFNLDLLLDYSTPMHYPIFGYIGSLTQPPCTGHICWYMVQRAFPITQKQLDFFKISNVKSNARSTDVGTYWNKIGHKAVWGPNNEIVDPDN